VNPFRRVVRSGVYQGLDIVKVHERGAVTSMVVVSAESADENHGSSCLGEAASGGRDWPIFEFIRKRWPVGHLPVWSRLIVIGEVGLTEITMGRWSDPGEGSDDMF